MEEAAARWRVAAGSGRHFSAGGGRSRGTSGAVMRSAIDGTNVTDGFSVFLYERGIESERGWFVILPVAVVRR